MAALGATVVSGLALGIDGAAHAAAVRAGTPTVAVIGGGHERLYPSAHRALARSIVDGGGAVLSEFPPDTQPSRGTFPRRNRIISGLADATVVVEAGARSGALTTAAWALEQGRCLYLVPGRLDDPAVAGCLAFLREAGPEARIVAGVPELLEDLGLLAPGGRRLAPGDALLGTLTSVEEAVAMHVAAGLASVDELVHATGAASATVLGRPDLAGGPRPRGGDLRALSGGRSAGRQERSRPTGDPPGARRAKAPGGMTQGRRGCPHGCGDGTLLANPAGCRRPSSPGAGLRRARMPPAGRMEDDVLRKLGATLLALPVLVLVYLVVLGRRGMARFGAGLAAAVVAAVVVLAGLPPAPSNAVPVSSKPQPVDARALDAVTTGHGLTKPFTVEFDAPMDPSSVAAALRLQPDTAVTFAWDDAGRVLTISPLSQWQPDTLYVLTVSKAARAADGGALGHRCAPSC